MRLTREPPLVAHIIDRLDTGGLENGLINLINRMPLEQYRHTVICLRDYTAFRNRIQRPEVTVHALHKRPGQDWGLYLRLWRLLRRLRPAIVHTRNLATLEAQAPAWLAGVRARVHGEHGWDAAGPEAVAERHHQLRRLCKPLVGRYVALSLEIHDYLRHRIGVPAQRIALICNGVDGERFRSAGSDPQRRAVLPAGFAPADALVVGTVGRMQAVKDQPTLARAFLRLLESDPGLRRRLRLVLVGDGPLRHECKSLLEAAGVANLAWLPGNRDDVPELLRCFDLFVLPSRAEGISNTLLEAMASGLPVVATQVGGNSELVEDGITGHLVPAADPKTLAATIGQYLNPDLLAAHGAAGRRRMEQRFSMQAMVDGYLAVYDGLLNPEQTPFPLDTRI